MLCQGHLVMEKSWKINIEKEGHPEYISPNFLGPLLTPMTATKFAKVMREGECFQGQTRSHHKGSVPQNV